MIKLDSENWDGSTPFLDLLLKLNPITEEEKRIADRVFRIRNNIMTLSEYANNICQRLLKIDVELDKQIFELKMIREAIYEDLMDAGRERYINRLQKCILTLENIKDNV